jgi:hypothetical protein
MWQVALLKHLPQGIAEWRTEAPYVQQGRLIGIQLLAPAQPVCHKHAE